MIIWIQIEASSKVFNLSDRVTDLALRAMSYSFFCLPLLAYPKLIPLTLEAFVILLWPIGKNFLPKYFLKLSQMVRYEPSATEHIMTAGSIVAAM